jgi:hypothetical protein
LDEYENRNQQCPPFSKLHIELLEQFESSRTYTSFNEPFFPNLPIEQPCFLESRDLAKDNCTRIILPCTYTYAAPGILLPCTRHFSPLDYPPYTHAHLLHPLTSCLQAHCKLPHSYILPLVCLLVEAEAPDNTNAAACALASAAKALPDTTGEVLAQCTSAYGVSRV